MMLPIPQPGLPEATVAPSRVHHAVGPAGHAVNEPEITLPPVRWLRRAGLRKGTTPGALDLGPVMARTVTRWLP